jgi:hypothetical protein
VDHSWPELPGEREYIRTAFVRPHHARACAGSAQKMPVLRLSHPGVVAKAMREFLMRP